MLEHERRLDNMVPFNAFVDGEEIEVSTKMGASVTKGHVMSVVPTGIIVRESNGGTRFCSEQLYLFSSLDEKMSVEIDNQLNDTADDNSLDARIKNKLAAMSEAGDPSSSNTGAEPIDKNASDAEYKDKDGEDSKKSKPAKKEPKEEPKKEPKKEVADPDSSIDVDNLPDDIKTAIITTDEMDASQLNGVIGEISDVALKALKRVGIRETSIFDIMKKINDSVYEILTGEKSPDGKEDTKGKSKKKAPKKGK